MRILKIILFILVTLALVVAALYFYYLHTPSSPKPALKGEFGNSTLTIQSRPRTFDWYKPENLVDGAALIFALHGSMSNGEQMRKSVAYEFDVLADKYGFLVVYPDGYDNHWNDCRGSADYAANKEDIDDIAFFREMANFFIDRYQIDPAQVFVTGHSNGGHMAYGLALEAPELVAAIAPISASLPVDANLDCEKSGMPVPVAIFNGTNDPVNPYDGGLVSIMGNDSRGEVLSSLQTAEYWADLAGAKQPAESIDHPESDGDANTSVAESRWQGKNEIQVRLYTLQGSGHVIPSRITSFPRLLGGDAGDMSGPEEIVAFFLGHEQSLAQ